MTIFEVEKPTAVSAVPWDRFLANSKIPQGETDELLTWISKVNQKKNAARCKRKRDFRKDALLESARIAAQNALQSKQKERLEKWRQVKQSLRIVEERDESLCDCDSCFLCQRHKPKMFGKCYCNVIFSPRPIFMDFNSSDNHPQEDEDSKNVDNFLASLSSREVMKRKAEEDRTLARKRCKA